MQNIKESLQKKIDMKTKPVGSLGKLETIALQVGMIQNSLTPELKNPSLLVFAGDHGISEEGVSPFPKEVTYQMVMNFIGGGAAINVFCRQNNINLKVVDAGVDHEFEPGLDIIHAKVALGTRNMMKEPAMSTSECNNAIAKGREIVRSEYEQGCNIIGFGEMGIGNTSPASLLMSHFTGISIDACTGRGTGHDDAGLKKKKEILKKVRDKYNPGTPLEALATFGGLEIAMMCGAMMEAADNNMVIMVDGFIATAAFLTACQLNAEVYAHAIFCHSSQESGHQLMLDHLQATPLVDLDMRLGEGSGVAVVYPLIQAAVNFLNQMASFDGAGVSNKT